MIAALADIRSWPGTAETLPAPEPKPWRPPLLICDAVTPAGGETLLLLLLREDRRRDTD